MTDLGRVLRYMLFTFESYYPAGGFNDFRGAFATLEAAKAYATGTARNQHGEVFDNWQVIDRETLQEVAKG